MRSPSAALLLVLAGCGDCGASRTQPDAQTTEVTQTQAATNPPAATPRVVQTGIVEGRILIAEGGELPSFPREMMPSALRTDVPVAECSPPKTTDRQPVTLAADGRGLVGVLVAAAGFRAAPPASPRTHEIAIRDCRLTPMFFDATVGDTMRLRNDSHYPHVPVIPGVGAIQQAMVPGTSNDFVLDQSGIKTIGCGAFGANCGRLDYVVMEHPVHTMSVAEGRFRLDNVPANEDLTVNAWHPLFRSATVNVRVAPGETRTVELVLTPEPPQVAPAPPPVPAHPLRPGEEFLD